MNFFQLDFKKIVLIFFIVALPLISVNFLRAPGEAPWFMKPFLSLSGGIQGFYSNYSHSIKETASLYLNLINIKRQNRELEGQIAELKAKMLQFEEIRIENGRLAKLLEFKSRSKDTLLTSRVIGHDLGGINSTIRIDRGSAHGVQRGQAVITPEGAVGSVLNVGTEDSQVLLVTDRYSVIDAVVERSRARGIVEGKSESGCRLKYLQRTDDVKVGDLVVTSGLDGIFPQGLPIGIVESVERKTYGITQKVDLIPFINPTQIEELFVVLGTEAPPQTMSKTPTEKGPESL